MKLTLVRHTAVDVPKGICYGKTDVPLASTFLDEMETIRQKIGSSTFDCVISSPLARCTQLAELIVPGQRVSIDHRLCELDFGDWEMTGWDSIFVSQEGKAWFADYVNTRCLNGESFSDQIARTRSFLMAIRMSGYKNVLLLTHAGSIRAMMCLLQDMAPQEAFNTPLSYGQIVTFSLDNK